MSIFKGTDGELRIYEGHTPLPFFVHIPFSDMNLTAPEGRARPEEILDEGLTTRRYAPLSTTEILDPLPLSFSLRLEAFKWITLRQALGLELSPAGVWTVGIQIWLSTYGTSTLYDARGNVVTRPSALYDLLKVCCNVEAVWQNPDSTLMAMRFAEVFFPPHLIQRQEKKDEITLSCQGQAYGSISRIDDFTTGIEA